MSDKTGTPPDSPLAKSDEPDKPATPRRSLRRRIAKALLLLVYVTILLEVACRFYWMFTSGVPFFHSSQVLRRFYPNLWDSGVLEADLGPRDGHLDVLLLGGSVLERTFGTVAEETKAQLAEATGQDVRVFNLSRRGHTSRDSYFRYREVARKDFDLVVFYHGINEVRMNCCPRSMFRDDYTHVAWYAQIESYYAHKELPYFVLPYTAEYTYLDILGSRKLDLYLPRHRPKEEWIAEGADIKTAKPFRQNLSAILDMARKKDIPVLLMTFALHVPPDYTLEKFKAKQLDYGRQGQPIELWGEPKNVVAAVRAHNAVIRDLHVRYDNTILVDQQERMPKGATYYNDCCHMTEAGCKAFVANVVAPVCDRLRKTGRLTRDQAGCPDPKRRTRFVLHGPGRGA